MSTERHHDIENGSEQSPFVNLPQNREQQNSTKTPRRALDLTDDETDNDGEEHDISTKRMRTCEDHTTDDDDFDTVNRKKKQQQHKTSQNKNDPIEPKQRDLTVFMKGCHRSLTNFIKDKWGSFEKEFRTRFHAPTSFKVVGHCLKIVCINPQQKKVVLQCEEMCKETVKVTVPFGTMRNQNRTTRKYVINDVPTSFSDQEITSAIGAEAARRIISARTGTKQPTGVVILDIKGPPPNTVNIGTLVFNLKDYIPRPARCTRCNSFTHRQHQCTEKQRCVRCDSDQHLSVDCPLTSQQQYRCKNCNGAHSAAFKGCPAYQEIQQILRVKTKQGVTFKEAAQQIRTEEEVEEENKHQDQWQHSTSSQDIAVSLEVLPTQKLTNKERESQQQSSIPQGFHHRSSQNKQQQPLKSRQPGKAQKLGTNINTPQHTKPADVSRCPEAVVNISKDTQQPDNNATLLVVMYELSSHMKEIAHQISYSNLSDIQHVSDTLLHLGKTIFGESFTSQLKQSQ